MARPKNEHKCNWPRCNMESDIVWLRRGLCESHWESVCKLPREESKIILGIKIRKES